MSDLMLIKDEPLPEHFRDYCQLHGVVLIQQAIQLLEQAIAQQQCIANLSSEELQKLKQQLEQRLPVTAVSPIPFTQPPAGIADTVPIERDVPLTGRLEINAETQLDEETIEAAMAGKTHDDSSTH